MSWRFPPMSPGDLNIDPIEHEFFASESLEGITAALVREAIQNSLDAAAGEKVGVRFALGQAEASAARDYLSGLLPHVEASADGRSALPDLSRPVRFLAVEDEGTRGLEGEPRQYEDDAGGGPRNDFYYFWRNVGRSRKESTDRGRWGLGKTVFAAASRLRAFFGLTVRRSDSRALLMGQAVLTIHRLGERRYRPYGYYGRHENGLSLPLDGPREMEAFRQCFALRRNGSGVSVVVPFPDEEISRDAILEAVLRHYFHPLLSGRLEVEIEAGGERPVVLREGGLEAEVRRRPALCHLLPVIELARWGQNPEAQAVAQLAPPPVGRAPKLTEDLFAAADLERLRRRYDEGRRLAIDARVIIERSGGDAREARFRLMMERDPEGARGEGHFVRQGITIENGNARRPRGVRWILIASDESLSAFLGDAENPAHTEWQRSSRKFKDKYRRGPSTLDFVRLFPANVSSLLSAPARGRDLYLLRDLFSLSADTPIDAKQRPQRDPAGEQESTVEESIPAALGKNGSLQLARVRTGFRLRGRAGEDAPRRLEVVAAYDVLRGNPFGRYSPLDFQMDRMMRVDARGARIVARAENRLEIEIEGDEFEVLVTRFDEKRDLRVKVQPVQEQAP